MVRDKSTYGFSKSDAAELIQLIGSTDRSYREGLVRGSGGAKVKLCQTPGGGLAARSGTTLGSATCDTYSSSDLTTSTGSVTVKNPWPFALPASFFFLAESDGANLLAINPGIIDLRLSGNDLQYTYDGTNWNTWTTATTC